MLSEEEAQAFLGSTSDSVNKNTFELFKHGSQVIINWSANGFLRKFTEFELKRQLNPFVIFE